MATDTRSMPDPHRERTARETRIAEDAERLEREKRAIIESASSVHDTEAIVEFDLTVRIPRGLAPAVLAALTGDDADLILAAEYGMASCLNRRDEEFEFGSAAEELAVDFAGDSRLTKHKLMVEANRERECVRLYGPAA